MNESTQIKEKSQKNVGELRRQLETKAKKEEDIKSEIITFVDEARYKFPINMDEYKHFQSRKWVRLEDVLELLASAEKTFPHLHCFKNQRWHPKARIVCSSCCFDKDCEWFLRWLGDKKVDET